MDLYISINQLIEARKLIQRRIRKPDTFQFSVANSTSIIRLHGF